MDTLFSIVVYILYGFVGFILLLFVLALLFGKRVRKQWELEAEFRDDQGREFGEFDIEMSRIEKDEGEFTFKAKFRMRHESLALGQRVQVFVDELLVMEGNVDREGRIFLQQDAVVSPASEASAGQVCRVVYGGLERFTAPLEPD